MKIGVISDTHDHMSNSEKFVGKFIEEKVDVVIHCGDIIAPFMKIPFSDLKDVGIPLYAVYGNNDGERNGLKTLFGRDLFEIKGDYFETELSGKKIIVFHHLSENMVKALALSGEYDLILKGHTHKKRNEKIGNCLVVNPGEACGYLNKKATVAVIELDDMSIKFLEL